MIVEVLTPDFAFSEPVILSGAKNLGFFLAAHLPSRYQRCFASLNMTTAAIAKSGLNR
jgi:hypothetical protein